tara:strand:- start:137 stop:490 length:354 start_codon:yes stop_codon:yes gene_type:complete
MRYFLVFILFFIGCNQSNNIDDSVQFFNNGLLEWEENEGNGRWTRLYENGMVQWQGNYIKGIDGLFCTNFYMNGQVSLEEFYIDGSKQGDCISYYRDGRIKIIETYNDGDLLNSVYY